jgi:hypothetical protein
MRIEANNLFIRCKANTLKRTEANEYFEANLHVSE